jgi:hypothetical protein
MKQVLAGRIGKRGAGLNGFASHLPAGNAT